MGASFVRRVGNLTLAVLVGLSLALCGVLGPAAQVEQVHAVSYSDVEKGSALDKAVKFLAKRGAVSKKIWGSSGGELAPKATVGGIVVGESLYALGFKLSDYYSAVPTDFSSVFPFKQKTLMQLFKWVHEAKTKGNASE